MRQAVTSRLVLQTHPPVSYQLVRGCYLTWWLPIVPMNSAHSDLSPKGPVLIVKEAPCQVFIMSTQAMLTAWIQGQKLKVPQTKTALVFQRDLEEALDVRRTNHALLTSNISAWKSDQRVDFCSNHKRHVSNGPFEPPGQSLKTQPFGDFADKALSLL